jgi:site-specific recombinase XerD
MEKDLCIHDVDKNLERYLETLKTSDITERNRQMILNFQEHCYSRGLTKYRILFYITKLNRLAKLLNKDFDAANKEDIERLAAEIEKSDYTDWTKHDYKVTIKIFYRWLEGNDEEYPEKVKWIKTTVKNQNK